MTLATAGLALKDVEVKHLAFSQMATALANGALDAALAVAPFTEIATGEHRRRHGSIPRSATSRRCR